MRVCCVAYSPRLLCVISEDITSPTSRNIISTDLLGGGVIVGGKHHIIMFFFIHPFVLFYTVFLRINWTCGKARDESAKKFGVIEKHDLLNGNDGNGRGARGLSLNDLMMIQTASPSRRYR
jgi:hypothetical protein